MGEIPAYYHSILQYAWVYPHQTTCMGDANLSTVQNYPAATTTQQSTHCEMTPVKHQLTTASCPCRALHTWCGAGDGRASPETLICVWPVGADTVTLLGSLACTSILYPGGRNVLNPTINSGCPLNKLDTRLITPGVSILKFRRHKVRITCRVKNTIRFNVAEHKI